MANRLQIRHGTNAPENGDLLPNELGWGNNALYIGGLNNNQNVVLPINITGNAATATNATNDSDGNIIKTTYLKRADIYISNIAMATVESGQTREIIINLTDCSFSNVPIVSATLFSTQTEFIEKCHIYVSKITTNECRIRIYNGYTNSRNLGASVLIAQYLHN